MAITRIFISNRGEIAVRVIQACKTLAIETVIGVSAADKDTLGAKLADRVVCIGPPKSADSYLNRPAIITTALATGCDAIHPGYGFLSEDAEFAKLCEDNGLVFIGPTPENIHRMGNKLEARALAKAFNIPLAEGSDRLYSADEAIELAPKIGYPVLLKAAAGGGGRGIRVVDAPEKLKASFDGASAEAQAAFGDGAMFMEKYIANARHIEVQILADHYGNVIHLGERDCSLQRRYQKMVEESPAIGLSDQLRKEIHQSAITLAKKIGYVSAGTVEFIVDVDRSEFYFLEMNTRVQVEHPVTEAVTGIDIVAQQILIAGGEKLEIKQKEVTFNGHSIECRINAEAPLRGFQPCPGRLTRWQPPSGENIRLDSHGFEGYLMPPYYDSLLGKLIVHGKDRQEAIAIMIKALSEFAIEGIETTIPFLQYVTENNEFTLGQFNTRWLEKAAENYMQKQATH
jgi:acetyl-CoA carboxylase biotin carboxylase subunit